MYRGRFAPSPSGPLHFGSLVAALASYLQAKTADAGHWLLRVDNIDPPREVAGSTEQILVTLAQHGLTSNHPVIYQGERLARYQAALDKLAQLGLVYGCICSRRQFNQRSTSNGRCPGQCHLKSHSLTDNAVRFRVSGDVTVYDRVMGPFQQNLELACGDFVVKRKDGLIAYQLATVVDDGEDRITEIVRGGDLLDNSPRQVALFGALGYTIPDFLHVPVAMGMNGQKLSKQFAARPLNPDTPLDNLLDAWRFLGQSRRLSPASIDEFWVNAIVSWDVHAIPAITTAVAPARYA